MFEVGLNFFVNGIWRLFGFLVTDDFTIQSWDFLSKINGVVLTNYSLIGDGNDQDDSIQALNTLDLSVLSSNFNVFTVDYCMTTSKCLESRSLADSNGHVVSNRPLDTANFFSDLSTSIINNTDLGINKVDSDSIVHRLSQINNFLFLDESIDYTLSEVSSMDYDLIILNPFLQSPNTSLDDMYTESQVLSLKTKSDGLTRRLVFAYLDVGFTYSNDYYWQTSWDTLLPDWIDQSYNSSNYYVTKYWRDQWKLILMDMLDTIIESRYDGIVFGHVDAYKNYPIVTD